MTRALLTVIAIREWSRTPTPASGDGLPAVAAPRMEVENPVIELGPSHSSSCSGSRADAPPPSCCRQT